MISAPPAVRSRRSGLRPRTPLERGQLAVLFTLVAVTAGVWTLTMDTPRDLVTRGVTPDLNAPAAAVDMGMAMDDAGTVDATGMAGAGGSLAGLVAFVVTWAAMMAAMMFPAEAPMILLFRSLATQRRSTGGAVVSTRAFVSGYLLVRSAAGAITWVIVQGLSDLKGALSGTERATWGPLALGAVLIGAGLYQLTPLKRFRFDHCRSPLPS